MKHFIIKAWKRWHAKGVSFRRWLCIGWVCLGEGGKDGKVNGVFWKKC